MFAEQPPFRRAAFAGHGEDGVVGAPGRASWWATSPNPRGSPERGASAAPRSDAQADRAGSIGGPLLTGGLGASPSSIAAQRPKSLDHPTRPPELWRAWVSDGTPDQRHKRDGECDEGQHVQHFPEGHMPTVWASRHRSRRRPDLLCCPACLHKTEAPYLNRYRASELVGVAGFEPTASSSRRLLP